MNINKPLRKSNIIKEFEDKEWIWFFFLATEHNNIEDFWNSDIDKGEFDEDEIKLFENYFKLFKPGDIECFYIDEGKIVEINYEFSKPYKYICSINNGEDSVIIFSNEKLK